MWRVASILNTLTGEVEDFQIRISDEGLADWLANRDRLRDEGKPDRPPDIDLDSLRAWVPHPGEERHPYFLNHPVPDVAEPDAPFPVMTVTFRGEKTSAQMMVIADPDGAFETTRQVISGNALVDDEMIEYPKEMPPEAVWNQIETDLQRMAGLTDVPGRLATYTDFEEMNAEMLLAKADVERGFISTLPEGPVQ